MFRGRARRSGNSQEQNHNRPKVCMAVVNAEVESQIVMCFSSGRCFW